MSGDARHHAARPLPELARRRAGGVMPSWTRVVFDRLDDEPTSPDLLTANAFPLKLRDDIVRALDVYSQQARQLDG
jgi:hypothetical protein